MRKLKISALISLFLVGIILTLKLIQTEKSNSISKSYTPKEIWEKQLAEKKEKRKKNYSKADKPDKFTEYYKGITIPFNEKESGYKMNYQLKALNKLKVQNSKHKNADADLNFISRGPSNVAGRTRALLIDPRDTTNGTWIVGAATGGIWKTSNSGESWKDLSSQLSNLSVNALAMSKSNNNVIYAGTGESFPGGTNLAGNGIWKSTNGGSSWEQLNSTATNTEFMYVNRIVLNPADDNLVIVATETGILKSTDGGLNWIKTYESSNGVEDLVEDPSDFNTLYAGANSVGVLRSTDAGDSWLYSSNGISMGNRVEIAVSKVNPNYVFASVNISYDESYVYISRNKGVQWTKFNDKQSFLSGQGDYDNTIEAHPFDENQVFVGGVDLWQLNFNDTIIESEPDVKNAYSVNADFIDFVPFGGILMGGGIDTSDTEGRTKEDWASIEIRFGKGISQKAHRFYVPMQATNGVARDSYTYIDYTEVPFQVWDVTNNRQLTVSFRDQERDGGFNLYESTGSAYGEQGREYIYINAVEYDSLAPNAQIAQTGGHWYKNLYMIWPTLAEGNNWDADNLADAKIVIDYGTLQFQNGNKKSIADAYGYHGGPNAYYVNSGFGGTIIPGLHPDHHNIAIIPTSDSTFTFIDANDGGLGISYDNAQTFNSISSSYITTQFYGVAKNPNANEYFGGMQDNGSWQSPQKVEAADTSNYLFRLGGDGFECLWHAKKQNLMLGSVYFNSIFKSYDIGNNWFESTNGMEYGDGPFITKLSASKHNPDLVFAVSDWGIYRSENFGSYWDLVEINSGWNSGQYISSSHNVKASLANGKVVWAGGAMYSNTMNMQLSVDYGKSFSRTKSFNGVGIPAFISGLATHPIDEKTAYVLYSLQGEPKILRTTNLGDSWEDISGFENSETSTNGFPDVVTHCLLVMPHAPNTIWVGTDIGIVESNNNGESWHLLNANFPAVSVYDMHISGKQVVIATHGRGIWSVDIPEIDRAPFIEAFSAVNNSELKITTKFKVEYDKVEVYLNANLAKTLDSPEAETTNISLIASGSGEYNTYLIGYINDSSFVSNNIDLKHTVVSAKDKNLLELKLYPNPSKGKFSISGNSEINNIEIFNMAGLKVYTQNNCQSESIHINIENQNSGTYFVKVNTNNKTETFKIILTD